MLNEARETTERTIDKMHRHMHDVCGFKPATNRKQARHQFLVVTKQKRLRLEKIKKAITQQLRYVKENLVSINALNHCRTSLLGAGLNRYRKLLAESELVQQQKVLNNSDTRGIPNGIVILSQSYIRLILYGKARDNVKFGTRIKISVTGEGFVFLDRLSWDSYNEGEDLKSQVFAFCRRHGYCSSIVLCYAKQIYGIQSSLVFCQQHNIPLNGTRLGRAKNDPALVAAEKQIALEDQRKQNGVEGKIGQARQQFGLDLVCEKLVETSGCTIAMNPLVMDLEKLLELLLVLSAIVL